MNATNQTINPVSGGGLLVLDEGACRKVIGRHEAFRAVESVFAAMALGEARNFPVVREAVGYADAVCGCKSGFDRVGKTLGVKCGGYWPGNAARGLTNHQSSVFLFDPDTGRLQAVVAGNYLTAMRTAASCAVSIAHLARKDSRVLGMVGAGHQSTFQLRAAVGQRDFEKIVAWTLHPDKLSRLAALAEELGLAFEAVTREALAAQADVIITVTSACEPLIMADWVRPGMHVACIGADTRGKQEIDPAILQRATVFTDEIAQSVTIGEAQHAVESGLITEDDITAIGAVVDGRHPGRREEDEITLFDATGVGLQDLAVASLAVRLARKRAVVTKPAL